MKFDFVAVLMLALSCGPSAWALDDHQITKVLETADEAEQEAAKYAQVHAQNREVKAFAKQMNVDHRESEQKAHALPVTPADAEEASALKTDAEQKLAELKTLKGKAFDRAYIDSQVDVHKKVLDTIDNQLLPSAQSEALKGHLQKVRPKIEAHLRQAETLQTKLSK